ncbi:MAG TPA: TrkA C-terminal domain-containing protein [Acidimicrobiales bacterium]|nr:TrkA C-terminal domain-containing protein [Acidimicrobiales bacterium]
MDTDKPRNLRTLLSEAKDTSELMVDLAYAALYFSDPGMADEVDELEHRLAELAQDLREIAVLAARSRRDAEAMASVLSVIGAIEQVGSAAVDIGAIVTRRLGIPRALVADLSAAEEVSHRVRVRDSSHMAHRPLCDLELPTVCGMRIVAIRRSRDWITDVDGDAVLLPGDVVFTQGASAGIPRLRSMAGAPSYEPIQAPADEVPSDLDRAVDVLVEMKNLSEVAVGLAYSALVLRDRGLAAEVEHLEDRLDDMKERLELWVLRSADGQIDPSPLRGLLHLAQASEAITDAAKNMVRLVTEGEELHPILAVAFGDSDEVVVRVPVAAGAPAEGKSLGALGLETETGFYLLAIRRDSRYLYRPRKEVVLQEGDELIATGPDEGHTLLAHLCGYRLVEHDETGDDELIPVASK